MGDLNDALGLGMLIGMIVGIAPVIVGALKKKLGLGIAGFFASIFAGGFLGLLLAVPVCGLFIYLIVRDESHKKEGVEQ